MAIDATTIHVTLPAMGESVTEGTVLEWHKAEGDHVEADETLVEISTDKVDAEVPAPVTGTVTELRAAVDDEIAVGKDCLVRSTDFTYCYEETPKDPRNPIYSLLLAVKQIGYTRQSGGYLSKALPALEFEYTEPVIDETVRDLDPESLANLPSGLDGGHYQWVDLDGEGLSGVLSEQAGSWFYKRNLSPANIQDENRRKFAVAQFGPLEQVMAKPVSITMVIVSTTPTRPGTML